MLSRCWLLLSVLLLAGCTAPEERTSVVLVTLDTVRADRLGCYGWDGAGTPSLDALAARGVRFEEAYSTAPLTLPAHASILTGTYPLYHGVRDNGSFRLDPRLTTLAEILLDAGYRTGAFVGAYPVQSPFGLDQGFELYDEELWSEPNRLYFRYEERPAEEVVAAAIDWLGELPGSEPFFAWVHLFDPHIMYQPPEPFASRYADDPYQGEIAYVDHALGELFDRLRRQGRLDNTVIFVLGDHGEALGDHGEDTHALFIYDSTMRVPLLVAGPGVRSGAVVAQTVSIVDVAPTVTDLLGLPAPDEAQGRSLAPLWRGEERESRPAYLETLWPKLQYGWSELRGVALDGWKYVEAPDAGQTPGELYRVAEDSGEQDNRAASSPEQRAALRERMESMRAELVAAEPFDAARDVTDEDLERLRALGYVGSGPADPGQAGRHPTEMAPVLRSYVAVSNLVREGRFHDALRRLDEIEQLDPNGLGLHENRGLVYKKLGQQDPAYYELAIDHLRKALAVNERRDALWKNLAEIHRVRGDYTAALSCYERAMEIAPAEPELQASYAGILAAVGRVGEGIELLERLLAEDPELVRGHLVLALVLSSEQRPEESLGHLERVVELAGPGDPDRFTAHHLAARIYESEDRVDAAIDHVEGLVRLAPQDIAPRVQLARLLERAGRAEDALEVWRVLDAVRPGDPGVAAEVHRLEELLDRGRSEP